MPRIMGSDAIASSRLTRPMQPAPDQPAPGSHDRSQPSGALEQSAADLFDAMLAARDAEERGETGPLHEFYRILMSGTLLLPVPPEHGDEAQEALASAVNDDEQVEISVMLARESGGGEPVSVVFGSVGALAAWAPLRTGNLPLPGRVAIANLAATGMPAIMDPAGPVPYRFEIDELAALAEGRIPGTDRPLFEPTVRRSILVRAARETTRATSSAPWPMRSAIPRSMRPTSSRPTTAARPTAPPRPARRRWAPRPPSTFPTGPTSSGSRSRCCARSEPWRSRSIVEGEADERRCGSSATGTVARVGLARPEVRNAFDAELIARAAHRPSRASPATRPMRCAASSFPATGRSSAPAPTSSGCGRPIGMSRRGQRARRRGDAGHVHRHRPVPGRRSSRASTAPRSAAAWACARSPTSSSPPPTTIFGFTETRLGILPAVISTFVLPKIGESHARALYADRGALRRRSGAADRPRPRGRRGRGRARRPRERAARRAAGGRTDRRARRPRR